MDLLCPLILPATENTLTETRMEENTVTANKEIGKDP